MTSVPEDQLHNLSREGSFTTLPGDEPGSGIFPALGAEVAEGEPFIGRHPLMRRAFELIASAADSRAPIWIHSEPGAGKSCLARVIHTRSVRRAAQLVELDCAGLPEILLGSELFGHAKGAFTGALSDKDGALLAAAGGTVFLDNIDSASPTMQARLLRLLVEKQYEPIGGGRTRSADIRLITSSSADLEEEVRIGRMRPDLAERLRMVRIELPPLRDRLADMPALVDCFLGRLAAAARQPVRRVSPEAMQCLLRYAWPENLRELELVLERAMILARGAEVQPADLPAAVALAQESGAQFGLSRNLPTLREAMVEPERRIIAQALKAHDWNRQRTAEALKIDRTTLYKKMKRYGLLGLPKQDATTGHQPEGTS